MTFTDDDLKRLKEDCERNIKAIPLRRWSYQADSILALLARLEAAEFALHYYLTETSIKEPERVKAWRKAAGK